VGWLTRWGVVSTPPFAIWGLGSLGQWQIPGSMTRGRPVTSMRASSAYSNFDGARFTVERYANLSPALPLTKGVIREAFSHNTRSTHPGAFLYRSEGGFSLRCCSHHELRNHKLPWTPAGEPCHPSGCVDAAVNVYPRTCRKRGLKVLKSEWHRLIERSLSTLSDVHHIPKKMPALRSLFPVGV
jgi:hypothetical protein